MSPLTGGIRRVGASLLIPDLFSQGLSATRALSVLRNTITPEFPRGLGYTESLFRADYKQFGARETVRETIRTSGENVVIPNRLIPQSRYLAPEKYKYTVEIVGHAPFTGTQQSSFITVYSDTNLSLAEASSEGEFHFAMLTSNYENANMIFESSQVVEVTRKIR